MRPTISRRLRLSDDRGTTLTELLVTIAILGVISSGITASVVISQRNLNEANATMYDIAEARLAVDRIGQLVRGAMSPNADSAAPDPAFIRAEAGRMEFWTVTGVALSDDDPIIAELFVRDAVGGQSGPLELVEIVDGRERVIARGLSRNDPFRYVAHKENGSGRERCGEYLAAPVSSSDRERIDTVAYEIWVMDDYYATSYRHPAVLEGWARVAASADLGYALADELGNPLEPVNCLDYLNPADSGIGLP